MSYKTAGFRIEIQKNNRKSIDLELIMKKRKILKAWGIKWQELVTKVITIKKIVDTGRLRSSMNYYVTINNVHVGTNVKYAA